MFLKTCFYLIFGFLMISFLPNISYPITNQETNKNIVLLPNEKLQTAKKYMENLKKKKKLISMKLMPTLMTFFI